MLADVPEELDHPQPVQPGGVVDQQRPRRARVLPEVDETRQLGADTGKVRGELVLAEEGPLLGLPAGIADRSCPPPASAMGR